MSTCSHDSASTRVGADVPRFLTAARAWALSEHAAEIKFETIAKARIRTVFPQDLTWHGPVQVLVTECGSVYALRYLFVQKQVGRRTAKQHPRPGNIVAAFYLGTVDADGVFEDVIAHAERQASGAPWLKIDWRGDELARGVPVEVLAAAGGAIDVSP